MNGLKPFKRTMEQTTEIMPPSHNTITAAAMTAWQLFNVNCKKPAKYRNFNLKVTKKKSNSEENSWESERNETSGFFWGHHFPVKENPLMQLFDFAKQLQRNELSRV